MHCITYSVQKPLQGCSRRANRPCGAIVWGLQIGTDWTDQFVVGGNVVPRLSDSADVNTVLC